MGYLHCLDKSLYRLMKTAKTALHLLLVLLFCAGCLSPARVPQLAATIALITATPGPTSSPTIPLPTATPDFNAPVWVSNPVERSVLRIDPASNQVTATIEIEGRPDKVIVGEGAIWVLDQQHELVFHIDPASNRVVTSIALPDGEAETIAAGSGSVWVGMIGRITMGEQETFADEEVLPPAMVVQINPRTHEITNQLPVQPVSRLALSGQALWVLSRTVIDTPLQVFNLTSNQGMTVPLKNAPEWLPAESMAIGPESLWLFSSAYGKIFRATPNGQVIASIDIPVHQPTGYADLLLDASGLWAATPWGSVIHVDPVTDHVLATLELYVPLSGLQPGGGSVWVVSQQTAAVYRINPSSHEIEAQISTGSPLSPTVIPSPTPRVVIWKPCPEGPQSRLKVGDLAYVTKDPPIPNRVRKEPNREADIIGHINPGASMEIIEGPACADGWVWWHIKNADLNGWTAEGDKETYWLVPLFN